ncbi:26S proteasome non-ATPase regulatory subunit 9 [Piromyces finnis]|uniref:Probable 26S proteasome regulatory subunit p27 n=1 Tax=Piromyces finnis TaxID=1754191 RepID=A0A1Y1V2S0_9FUNG|nr:26S proteasome non-ATPase regulatory subunit 9 [Piromyces finnis]|eukprot:ORX45984.1 26S proteasome non-ATPase regulatory subunit 9 [Piromyces finnis]
MTNPITISQYESESRNFPKKGEELKDTCNMNPMEKAQYLIKRKDAIEQEIIEWEEVLNSHKVGMNDSLLDSEGFPRSDIDIVQIRIARNKIICLKNDYKDIMKNIEQALYDVHKDNKEKKEKEKAQNLNNQRPFAIVNTVADNSPASKAGLLEKDKIINFGTINESNHENLKALAKTVMDNKNKPINITVQREENVIANLTLTPKEWSGRGLLGCHILPY